MMVQRWNTNGTKSDYGDWVRVQDYVNLCIESDRRYDRLTAERDAAKYEAFRLSRILNQNDQILHQKMVEAAEAAKAGPGESQISDERILEMADAVRRRIEAAEAAKAGGEG